jgi:hypothetical protein
MAAKLAADEFLNRERPVLGPGAKFLGASGFDGKDIPGWLVCVIFLLLLFYFYHGNLNSPALIQGMMSMM